MDEKLFTIKDLRAAFVAGEEFESDSLNVAIGEKEEVESPDFGDWVEKNYGITV